MLRVALLLLALVGAALLWARPAPAAPCDGATAGALRAGGLLRTYRVYAPPGLPARPALVLVLHGKHGSGAVMERKTGFDCLARTDGFVVAYPDGTPIATGRAWNAGTCCGRPVQDRVDDVGFLARLIDRLARDHRVDPRRVYVAGSSNGGMMAYRLACRLAPRIAAIGVNAGTMNFPCRPRAPVSVVELHGTADPIIPYDGGVGLGATRLHTPPIARVDDTWARLDRCAGRPSVTVDGTVRVRTFGGCAPGTAVVGYALGGGGHGYPGTPGCLPRPGFPCASDAVDATATFWRFFRDHPRPDRTFAAVPA